tara:strand:+ start:56 stop:295 length:240 start_codon:yes stop_codon:yes gene_type:complete
VLVVPHVVNTSPVTITIDIHYGVFLMVSVMLSLNSGVLEEEEVLPAAVLEVFLLVLVRMRGNVLQVLLHPFKGVLMMFM